MKIFLKKTWPYIGISGLLIITLLGLLIYMNIRPADPILAGWEEYDALRFEELMQRDEPVLVEIYAPWCPTCLLQHKAFETLSEKQTFPKVRAIRVDFDEDEDFIKGHHLYGTGMLIIFLKGKEISRASGLVTPDSIEEYLENHFPKKT